VVPFDDVFAANDAYVRGFPLSGLEGRPARRLAVLTCMDTRVDPLPMLGLEPGDAVVLRNAGARTTDDVLESLALAERNLGIDRVLVIAHRDCRAAAAWSDQLPADPATRAREAGERIREATGLEAAGATYDETTGRLTSA
jgi:carbonic anhydrase